MRVIAGRARRLRLTVAKEGTARPFLEQARGAVFNALAPWIEGARVLDGYAGSGALGIEALSRGAAEAVFVERDRASVDALRENLQRCALMDEAVIRPGAVERILPGLREPFDLIFLDPPFPLASRWQAAREGQTIIAETERLLQGTGRLVFRYEGRFDPPSWGALTLQWQRRYGRSNVCFYGPATDDPSENGAREDGPAAEGGP